MTRVAYRRDPDENRRCDRCGCGCKEAPLRSCPMLAPRAIRSLDDGRLQRPAMRARRALASEIGITNDGALGFRTCRRRVARVARSKVDRLCDVAFGLHAHRCAQTAVGAREVECELTYASAR
ncbi:MAG TPA: hypothetical protein VIF62_17550 [Labilithrix sp.]